MGEGGAKRKDNEEGGVGGRGEGGRKNVRGYILYEDIAK